MKTAAGLFSFIREISLLEWFQLAYGRYAGIFSRYLYQFVLTVQLVWHLSRDPERALPYFVGYSALFSLTNFSRRPARN